MNGYPITYAGLDGLAYVATYRGADWSALRGSRVSIERVDGRAVKVSGRSYPAGYVAGWGDAFASTFLLSIEEHRL